MKTYLFDTFNRFRRYSEKLDVKTILCNRSWWVFNDNGEKETYIFNEDGSIIITKKGQVTDGTWQYMPVNRSVIIRANDQKVMVVPSFVDGVILSLQVDGTNQYAFLIDEQNKAHFAPKTYSGVIEYFKEKEIRFLEDEKERDKNRIEELKRKEEERIKKEQEKFKKVATEKFESWDYIIESFIISIAITTIIIALLYHSDVFNFIDNEILLCGFLLIPPVVILFFYAKVINPREIKLKYKKFLKENPGDPKIPYLTELCKKYLK